MKITLRAPGTTDAFEFILNGQIERVDKASPNQSLLHYLRARGFVGTKEGCAEGECGACAVALVERNAAGQPTYRAINSCLTLLPMVADREIVTIEALGASGPHPVQAAMTRHHGSQCGFCTPGFVMSLFEGYYRDDLTARWQVAHQLDGNLCRCTGYRAIRDAAAEAFTCPQRRADAPQPDLFRQVLKTAPVESPQLDYVTRRGRFSRPASWSELFRMLGERRGAKLIGGGTELALDVTLRHRPLLDLISTEAVPELQRLEKKDGEWRIGGGVTLTRLEEALGDDLPPLRDMLRVWGSRLIRNRATLGGNLVTASPLCDTAPVLLALDAFVILATETDERAVWLDEFFTGYRQTVLRPGEVLREVVVPPQTTPPGRTRRAASFKVSKRREMAISTVGASFRVDLDANQVIVDARLAFAAVAPTPRRAKQTEQFLVGKPWTRDTILAAAATLSGEFQPIDDVRGSADYRRAVVTDLLMAFFEGRAEVPDTAPLEAPAPQPVPPPHESGHLHVAGRAAYVDDQALPPGTLETWLVTSPHAHARIKSVDASAARKRDGVHAVLVAADVPGSRKIGPVVHDEPLLADEEVLYAGQPVACVVARDRETARLAAAEVVVDYEPLPAVASIESAIDAGSFLTDPHTIRRGEPARVLAEAPHRLSGELHVGGQEHFYLETQAAWARPGEDGEVFVSSSTQHPTEVQLTVAHVLGLPQNRVTVEVPRMGGGFGGKETQAAQWAALAALGAVRTGRAVRVRLDRTHDMRLTGKRHPFLARFEVGFDDAGRLLALRAFLFANGGFSLDLSGAIVDRAMFHLDNAYLVPHLEVTGRACRTHLCSQTAFRGFGGPQGMIVIEDILARVARQLNLPPELVRERNLYHGLGATNTTHYGQELGDNRLIPLWNRLKETSGFDRRRREIAAWNAAQPSLRRGLAITPVKFGISFTTTFLNQAGAHVLVYTDGTAQVNHGGTEMGQGLHTKMREVAALTLGLDPAAVRVMPTRTDQVPNTSATAASCGTDLNGHAVREACDTLRQRLTPIAVKVLSDKSGAPVDASAVTFTGGTVAAGGVSVPFAEVARRAWLERVSLAASGFYRTPEIHYDRAAGRGRPFYYFAYGAAVSEVEVDGRTGMFRLRRVDILHDVGASLSRGVDRGQVEGGFIQGVGWLTCESLKWNPDGSLQTASPSVYKIPTLGDAPPEFHVEFLPDAAQSGTIRGSKAVGEPPLMLAFSVREAIRDAVGSFGPGPVDLESPCTPEVIHAAIRRLRPAETPPAGEPAPRPDNELLGALLDVVKGPDPA